MIVTSKTINMKNKSIKKSSILIESKMFADVEIFSQEILEIGNYYFNHTMINEFARKPLFL